MKPAVLASSAALLLAACAPDGPPPVAPPSVVIAPPPAEPPGPDGAARPAVRFVAAPSADWIAALRDPRRRAPRSRGLVVTEIQQLETLASVTQPTSPDRPKLLRRLAEDYVELAASAGGDDKLARNARHHAIEYYQRLNDEHPGACLAPNPSDPSRGTGCGDEVLYFRALEAERAGQLDTSRKSYLTLLQSHPNSPYVPAAYFAFGEMFLADAAADPSKLPLAEQSYSQTLKYPPPENRLYGLAHYRLAQVFAKKGDDPRALASFVKAAAWAAEHPEGGGLAPSTRREAVEVYARSGDPAQARAFFSRFASGDELEQMLADLEKRRPSP